MSKKLGKSNMIALITIYGQSRYSILAYRHLVKVLKEHRKMPSDSTVRLRLLPYILDNLTAKSSTVPFASKSGVLGFVKRVLVNGDTSTSLATGNKNNALIIPPSEWARLDLRCYNTFDDITCYSKCRCNTSLGQQDIRIESTDYVRARKRYSERPFTLWVSKDNVPFQGQVGMTVSLSTFRDQIIPQSVPPSSRLSLRSMVVKNEEHRCIEASILCTYVVQHSAETGPFLSEGLKQKDDEARVVSVEQCVSLLQRMLPTSSPGTDPVSIPSSTSSTTSAKFTLNIGDHLTLLSSPDDIRGHCMLVFINRYWASRLDDDRQFIFFVHASESDHAQADWIPAFGMPRFVSQPVSDQDDMEGRDRGQGCFKTGLLSNGQRFYMYRLLLYADDFNPRSALFPRGSVGGVYMSPAGFSVRTRRSQKTIRTISVTPNGISTNFVLDFIIDDLVSASLDGIQCVDPFGEQIVCYFDILGFLADYPASSTVVDVLGHTASAPCTHCGFVLLRSLLRSRYAFSTILNSCHSMLRRTQWRVTSMRSSGFSTDHARQLGLKDASGNPIEKRGKFPLLKLAARYNKSLLQLTHSPPFNSDYKDGYQLNIVAPDHLITGLMKGTLFCTFTQLPSDSDRDNLQILLKSSMLEFGFQTQLVFFQKKKLVPGLTMSLIYAIFTVLPALLESMGRLDTIPTKKLIFNLHNFASLAFWWPSLRTDGSQAWAFIHGNNSTHYHSALHRIACNFVRSVDRYVTKHPSLGKYVDRPNTHRLLELTTHTLSIYRHLLYVCELVFESAHQPLKFLLSRNTTSKSHITAAQIIVIKDWIFRIWGSWFRYQSDNSSASERAASMHTLMRLFCGEKFDKLDWAGEHLQPMKSDIQQHIIDVLSGTIGDILCEWYVDNSDDSDKDGQWVVHEREDKLTIQNERRQLYDHATSDLGSILNISPTKFIFPTHVMFRRGFGSCCASSHEKLRVGDVVQVLVSARADKSRFVEPSTSGDGKHSFFLIVGMVAEHKTNIVLLIRRCESTHPSHLSSHLPDYNNPLINRTSIPTSSLNSSNLLYIRLDVGIRKVGVLHDCKTDSGCRFNSDHRTVAHSRCTLDGGHFFYCRDLQVIRRVGHSVIHFLSFISS